MITEHRKQYLKTWRFENAESCRKQKREWARAHPWIGWNNVFKWLSTHGERSMFPAFAALDEHRGWIESVADTWPDPSLMLQIKETVVT